MEPMVDALCRVGVRLQAEYGEAIPVARIREEVPRERGQNPGSGCPSDVCYNVRKDGMRFPNTPMFERVGRGLYRYHGLGFPYTGPVFHRPQGAEEYQYGRWEAGTFYPA